MFRVCNWRSCKSWCRLVFLQLVSRKFYWRSSLVILENGIVGILRKLHLYWLYSYLISARAAAVVAKSYKHASVYTKVHTIGHITLHCTYAYIAYATMLLNVWAHEKFSRRIVVTPSLWLCKKSGKKTKKPPNTWRSFFTVRHNDVVMGG